MKKSAILLLIATFTTVLSYAQDNVYSSDNGKVSFSSHAPLEDIYAESNELTSAINTSTNVVAAKLKVNTLKMENSLQQEHLHEKYLESHKYAYATFKGKLLEDVKWGEDGVYNVKAEGDLVIHGVGKKRVVDVEITIKDGVISSSTTFKVRVEDHKVKIPKLVIQKVAEEVEVKMEATYQVFEANK